MGFKIGAWQVLGSMWAWLADLRDPPGQGDLAGTTRILSSSGLTTGDQLRSLALAARAAGGESFMSSTCYFLQVTETTQLAARTCQKFIFSHL